MKVIDLGGWRFFVGDDRSFDRDKTGKWMYFFKGPEGRKFTEERCREAVEQGIVAEAKCTDSQVEGTSCFYLNIDDKERHKRILQYFLDHNMIRRTKTGKLYNISFKLDNQTRAGEYGADYKGELKLEDFLDLNTGRWLV